MSREGLLPQLQTRGIQVRELKYSQQSVSVYQGTFQNYAAAIKILSLTPAADSSQLEKECRTLMSLSHPNILQLYQCFWENNGVSYLFVIVTEWCEKDLAKDMKQRAENRFPWVEDELWKLTFEVVSALTYMQEQGISHRDIKPENIFLTLTKSAKLGDFGSARTFLSDIDSATLTGTPFYLSPKLREGFIRRDAKVVHNSFKSDVYSLGLTLLSLSLLDIPLSLAKVNVSNAEVQTVISTIPYSDLLKSMLSQMLSVDEDTRCDFKILQAWIETNDPRHEKPKIPPPNKARETLCMQCQHVIDPFSEIAQCEVVQLYCEPSKHMFCSRECCKDFLSSGSSKCPQCSVDIPIETIEFYLPEALREESVALPKIPVATGTPRIEEPKQSLMPIQAVEEKPKGEILCLHCRKPVDRYSSTAECEVVQLYCQPSLHMFCSRECCRVFLSSGSSKCPQCSVDIPIETIAFYLPEALREETVALPKISVATGTPRIEEPKQSLMPIQAVEEKPKGEILCLHCRKPVDRYSSTAECEVVQLYCQPSLHMFCSRECCRVFLSSGSSMCPQCSVGIPDETITFYQIDPKHEQKWSFSSENSSFLEESKERFETEPRKFTKSLNSSSIRLSPIPTESVQPHSDISEAEIKEEKPLQKRPEDYVNRPMINTVFSKGQSKTDTPKSRGCCGCGNCQLW